MYMDTYHVDLLSRKLHDMVLVLSWNTDMERTAAFARATLRTDDARKGWYANHAHANGHESGHDASWCKQLLDLFGHTSSRLTQEGNSTPDPRTKALKQTPTTFIFVH